MEGSSSSFPELIKRLICPEKDDSWWPNPVVGRALVVDEVEEVIWKGWSFGDHPVSLAAGKTVYILTTLQECYVTLIWEALTLILLDLPGLLFFTTYTLLVLFWAEIYYQAKSLPTDKLRAWYLSVNCVIYVIQELSILIVGLLASMIKSTLGLFNS